MYKDPESGAMQETGLVRCKAVNQTAGGVKIDVGGGGGGASGAGAVAGGEGHSEARSDEIRLRFRLAVRARRSESTRSFMVTFFFTQKASAADTLCMV